MAYDRNLLEVERWHVHWDKLQAKSMKHGGDWF